MEPNDTTQLPQFSSYFHHQQHHHHHHHQSSNPAAAAATAPSPTNGLLPPNNTNNNEDAGGGTHQMGVYPHSVTSTAVTSPPEAAKRKRGRPRKYGTPEQALAAKKAASSSYNSAENRTREESSLRSCGSGSSSYSSRKSQAFGSGNLGQGFTPHVITVAAGEDVTQKIMMFMQQSKREICILCASGSISNVSLRQPATSGGSITYEGRFEIISLSGSYIRTEIGGRTGGLSVCLSSSDGQIIGGGVGGPLKAAGPVQVIVGSFSMDTTKDVTASGSKLTSPVGGAPVSSLGFRSPVESSGRNLGRGGDDLQNMGGSHFMISPPPGMPVPSSRPMEWRSSGGYELTGRTGHGGHQSPENGDYDQIPD